MVKNKNKNNTTKNNRVFFLDIRNDSYQKPALPTSANSSNGGHRNIFHHNSTDVNTNNNALTTTSRGRMSYYANNYVSCETTIHRRIIEMYKCRDDFEIVDMNVRTSQPLSGHTRVDIANALQHMKNKCGKMLRKMSADMDYVDFSVHEFIVLHCLAFEEVELTSNPEEQTTLSEGLSLSLRHALTSNKKCIRSLTLSCCTLSEETCGILCDAFMNSYSLEVLHVLCNTSNLERLQRRFIPAMLEGLIGRKKLIDFHLGGASAHDLSTDNHLSDLLSHKQCGIENLYLGYDWNRSFDSHKLFQSFLDTNAYRGKGGSNTIRCESLIRLQFDGINFADNTLPRELALIFPNLETLSVACHRMPKLAFLDLPDESYLPQKLQRCYFPCTQLDFEEGRKLVRLLPNVSDAPDLEEDVVVKHYLDWTRCGRAQIRKAEDLNAALWPLIFQRAYRIMSENQLVLLEENEIIQQKTRRAGIIYSLLHHYQAMNKIEYRTVERDGLLFIMEQNSNEQEEACNSKESLWNRMTKTPTVEEEEAPDEMTMVFGNNDDNGDY